MRKFMFFILFMFLAIPCFGELLTDCPVDGKSLTIIYDGDSYESDVIDCSESFYGPGSCNIELRWWRHITGNTYEIVYTSFYCSESKIAIDSLGCFYSDGTVICPLTRSSDMMTFTVDGVVYKYSKDIPMLPVTVSNP